VPPTFGWDNLEDIAIGLTDKFPDTDPLTVRFTDLRKWITELPTSAICHPERSEGSQLFQSSRRRATRPA